MAGLGDPGDRSGNGEYALKESRTARTEPSSTGWTRPPARVLDLGCSGGLLARSCGRSATTWSGVDVVTHPEVKERADEFVEADLDHGLPAGLRRTSTS